MFDFKRYGVSSKDRNSVGRTVANTLTWEGLANHFKAMINNEATLTKKLVRKTAFAMKNAKNAGDSLEYEARLMLGNNNVPLVAENPNSIEKEDLNFSVVVDSQATGREALTDWVSLLETDNSTQRLVARYLGSDNFTYKNFDKSSIPQELLQGGSS